MCGSSGQVLGHSGDAQRSVKYSNSQGAGQIHSTTGTQPPATTEHAWRKNGCPGKQAFLLMPNEHGSGRTLSFTFLRPCMVSKKGIPGFDTYTNTRHTWPSLGQAGSLRFDRDLSPSCWFSPDSESSRRAVRTAPESCGESGQSGLFKLEDLYSSNPWGTTAIRKPTTIW